MRVLCKLFTTVHRASDGSLIKRDVVADYLNSDSYKTAIERGTILSGLTHRDRVLSASPDGSLLKSVVGKDDNMILNKNIVAVTEKIFLPSDPSDEWVYGIMRIFDESVMDGKSAEAIRQVKGLIANGVKLTTSTVIIG